MQRAHLSFWLMVIGITAGITLLDWLTKQWAANQGRIMGHNPGISFGLLPQLESWWIIVAVAVLIVLIVWGWSTWQNIPAAVGLLIGGAAANVVDRLATGAVRDWLPIPFAGVYNNIADWAIFFSLLWFFFARFEPRKSKNT